MRALAYGAAIAVLAAGCGSGGSSANELTAQQWRREANAICRNVGRKVLGVIRPKADDQGSAFVAAVAPLWQREKDGIGALEPPPELAGGAGAYVDALDYLLQSLVEVHTSAQRGDESRHNSALLKTQDAARQARQAAAHLVLPACLRQRMP